MAFAYNQPLTFLGLDQVSDIRKSKRMAVLGMPIDSATTNRSGARMGPNAIRAASTMLTDGAHPQYSVDLMTFASDCGNVEVNNRTPDASGQNLQGIVAQLFADKKIPVILGGDHSLTYYATKGRPDFFPKSFKEPISVIHFDAHCDTWNKHGDEADVVAHGTWLRRSISRGYINPKRSVQIGIRSPVDTETKVWFEQQGGTVITARDALFLHSPSDIATKITQIVEHTPVWLTFDIDALDPAFAPGTGTPEVGGLSTAWVLSLLESLPLLNWIGMDMVEVAPAYDHSEITALAAATITWAWMSMIAYKWRES